MVEAAAAAHRVFLQRPQARRGLSRAADAHFGAFGARDIVRRQRRDAGQPADEIQRGPLRRENGARRARDRQHVLPAGNARGVADMRAHLDVGRELLQRRQRQRQSGDHAGLARDQDRLRFVSLRELSRAR